MMNKLFKLMTGMFAIATFALTVASCVEEEDKDRTNNGSESAVTVAPYETSIRVGEKQLLTATVLPLNSGTPSVTWTSSDDNIVSVSGSGVRGEITGTGEGTTTVTASANGKSSTCVVTVTPAIPVDAITVSADTTIVAGRTLQLHAAPVPEGATYYNPVWSSNDNAVVSVSATGLVTAVAPGVTTVTVTSDNIFASVSASVTITVIPVVPLDDFTIAPDVVSIISPGSTKRFKVTLYPENATEYFPVWTSSNPAAAIVSETGLLVPIEAGKTTITLTSGSIQKTVEVNVVSVEAIYNSAKAHWTFEDPANLGKATKGNDLELGKHEGDYAPFKDKDIEAADGPSPVNKSVFLPKGAWARAVYDIPANGGGSSRVNEYTIILDFKPMVVNDVAYTAVIQTDVENRSETDLYLKSRGRIGNDKGTSSDNTIKAGNWYRLIITLKAGESYKWYLDGTLLVSPGVPGVDEDRYTLDTRGMVFFGDGLPDQGGNGEFNEEDVYVAGIAIWDYVLSADDISLLGGFEKEFPN
jgi:uncharacterized protein YjdB